MVSSAGLTSSRVPPSPSRRAAATGGHAYGWMGQKVGWSAGPMKLHAETTELPEQLQTFTFQTRQAHTDAWEGANGPLLSICFTADARASV